MRKGMKETYTYVFFQIPHSYIFPPLLLVENDVPENILLFYILSFMTNHFPSLILFQCIE